MSVRECGAELLEPQSSSRDDFLKFVSSLALSVHVEAALSNVEDPTSVAILVSVLGIVIRVSRCKLRVSRCKLESTEVQIKS